MLPSEAREAQAAARRNLKLKRLVADLSLDKVMLQDVVQKSSKAGQAARGDALLDGPIRRQYAAGVPGRACHAIVGVLPELERSAHGPVPAHARAGADARPLRLASVRGSLRRFAVVRINDVRIGLRTPFSSPT